MLIDVVLPLIYSLGVFCVDRKSKDDTWVSNNTYWELRREPGFSKMDFPVLWWPLELTKSIQSNLSWKEKCRKLNWDQRHGALTWLLRSVSQSPKSTRTICFLFLDSNAGVLILNFFFDCSVLYEFCAKVPLITVTNTQRTKAARTYICVRLLSPTCLFNCSAALSELL